MVIVTAPSRPSCRNTRGPPGFVIDPARNEWVRVFAEMTTDERPVKLFPSIHRARRWLDEISKVEAKR